MGEEEVIPLPAQSPFLSSKGLTRAALSSTHHVYICNGKLWSVGAGESGQLGQGDRQSLSTPKQIYSLKNENFDYVAVSAVHSCALTKKGILYTFGIANAAFFCD